MDSIRSLIRILPPPASRYEFDGVRYRIYRCKDLFRPRWNHPALKALVMQARRSFAVYGARPVLDSYDGKAAIYLARATYNSVEEWLSIRLVPYSGKPRGIEELAFFRHKRRNIETIFCDRRIMSYSRICGIGPYYLRKPRHSVPELSRKHKASALSFALMYRQFHDEYLKPLGCRYVAAIVLDKLLTRTLAPVCDGKRYKIASRHATCTLGLGNAGEVRLIRTHQKECAYRYPGYFLDIKQLLQLLKRLVKEGLLTEEAVRRALAGATPGELLARKEFVGSRISGLGALTAARGIIPGTKLTGARLRKLIDLEVDDAPRLHLTGIRSITRSLKGLFAAAEKAGKIT